jgi:hypothetical protein
MGLVAALAEGFHLANVGALSPIIVVAMWLVSTAGSLALAMATKIVTGKERLTYYHHEIVVVLAVTGMLWILRAPVLADLDLEAIGLGIFLAFGRIGCLQAGCCYGRPFRRGIRYRSVHVSAGFPEYLSGIRLLPVQAIESAAVLALSGSAVWMVLSADPPGTAFASYISGYAGLRFLIEFLRGDPERPEWRDFSEAQWTSLLLSVAVLALDWLSLLPHSRLHAWVAAGIVVTTAAVAIVRSRRRAPLHRLLHPSHMRELAYAIAAPHPPGGIAVASTSMGIRISGGQVIVSGDIVRHVTLSWSGTPPDPLVARRLANLVGQLSGAKGTPRLVVGQNDSVFHLVIEKGTPGEVAS